MAVDPAGVDLSDPASLPNPFEIRPFDAPVDATVVPPGSKSITNRALVCAALTAGDTVLDGLLWSDDTEAMVDGLGALGVAVDGTPSGRTVVVRGSGGRLRAGPATLFTRLSGTTSRFLAAAVVLGVGRYDLDAAGPMRARPMAASFEALRQLGAEVAEAGAAGRLPVSVTVDRSRFDARAPAAVRLAGDVTSQALSGLLMIGPCLPAGLVVELTTDLVSRPYVDLTLAVMRSFGATVDVDGDRRFAVSPGGYPGPAGRTYRVEPDATAATYLIGAAAVCGGRVRVDGLGATSPQGDVHFADVLERMGVGVSRGAAEIEVRVEGRLRGVDVDLEPMSDTAQTLAAIAVFAGGPTRVRGIDFVRNKETDRLSAVVTEMRRLGIDAREELDGFVVHPGTPRAGIVRTYDDHRMAMSFALLGLRVPGISIADPACVAKTFPGYFAALESLRPKGG